MESRRVTLHAVGNGRVFAHAKVPVEIGGAVLAKLVELAEGRVAAHDGEVAVFGGREEEEHLGGDGALAVVAQGERVALAQGRAEVEATEDHGDLTKGSVVGARKNRDEPGFVERCGCVVARRWQRGAGAAGTNLAEFVEEGCGDGLGRRARLRLRLC